ncbi:N-6 DNA methylase [Lactiplantibacillus paraxiangfangensis]|uniref:N-6 DNA methylase n=1 Tax=Lactiplantibacillus paraxiangfangensis TaxID=3076224 RepID=UPI0030C6F1D5
MKNTKNIEEVKQAVWNVGNKYREQFESVYIVTIWIDMIYLHAMKPEYASILEQAADDLKKMTDQLRVVANSDEVELAVINDFSDSIRRILLPRTTDDNRLQVFNGIREDGLELIHIQYDRIALIKILQQMNIDFGPQSNGQIATPNQINDLMVRIAEVHLKNGGQVTVYDPAAGTGGSLIAMRRMLDSSREVTLVGQEINTEAYMRCAMMLNLINDDTTTHRLINNDVFNEKAENKNLRADIVISDPPYSVKWAPNRTLLKTKPYSEIGVLPPKSKADFAFVLHGLEHLKDNGIMVIQLPHGVLFRGAAEAKIRQYLLERNYIDAVIGLPANLQYETSIPTMLLVLRKGRSGQDVLFIDASDEVEKLRPNNILPELSVKKITDSYKRFSNIDQYAHVATHSEIVSNDYNLNIPRYVDKFIPPEVIPVSKLEEQLSVLNEKLSNFETVTQDIMSKYKRE